MDRPNKLTIFVDGPQGSGVTKLANLIRSESVLWDAVPKFEVIDMSEQRDGQPEGADRDIAIGEHAFKAGFNSCGALFAVGCASEEFPETLAQAWSEYTPPDELCGG